MLIKNTLRHYWKSIFIFICILYLSFAPPSTFKKIPTFENIDKLVHFLMYAGLTIVLIYDFRTHKKNNTDAFAFVLSCILFPCIIGGLIEILQPKFFAPRSASWGDFAGDIAGVFMGWLAMFIFKKLKS